MDKVEKKHFPSETAEKKGEKILRKNALKRRIARQRKIKKDGQS